MADPTQLFTVSEARAFDRGQLADTTAYPTGVIEAKEAEIREWLTRVCRVDFIPTAHTETLDGDGSDWIALGWPLVISVTKVMIDGETLGSAEIDADDYGSGLAIDAENGVLTRRGGSFAAGWSNVIVDYKAGHATVPRLIKRAALMICVTELPVTNVPFAAEDIDAGGITVSYARGDGFNGSWHRIPDVQKALRMYTRALPGVA